MKILTTYNRSEELSVFWWLLILVLILVLKAENHSRRRGRDESRSIEEGGRFRLRGEFERRNRSSSRGLARQYSHHGEAGKV